MKIYSTDDKPPTDVHVAKPLTGKKIREMINEQYEHEPHIPLEGEPVTVCPICFSPISESFAWNWHVKVINGKGAGLL